MVAALLTDIEDASQAFERGFVTYSQQVKSDLLVLRKNEAVSEVVARAMADGALACSNVDIALGATGFAGPADPNREEGLVHFGLARRGRRALIGSSISVRSAEAAFGWIP